MGFQSFGVALLGVGLDIIGPVACTDCCFDGDIRQEWFYIDPPIRNKKDLWQACDVLTQQEGYKTFDSRVWQKGTLASASRCPKCGSECLEEGY